MMQAQRLKQEFWISSNIPMEGLTMEKENPTLRPKEFTIPVELLKAFRNDVRTLPHILPTNGWIIFDRAMLTSILRGDDLKARTELAKQIDKLAEIGGELVIMGR